VHGFLSISKGQRGHGIGRIVFVNWLIILSFVISVEIKLEYLRKLKEAFKTEIKETEKWKEDNSWYKEMKCGLYEEVFNCKEVVDYIRNIIPMQSVNIYQVSMVELTCSI
jgi:hypothetical protein